MLFSCVNNWCADQIYPRYILNFNMMTFMPVTTLAIVTGLSETNGNVTVILLQAVPLHYSFGDNETVQYNPTDDKGRFNILEAPFAQYGGKLITCSIIIKLYFIHRYSLTMSRLHGNNLF